MTYDGLDSFRASTSDLVPGRRFIFSSYRHGDRLLDYYGPEVYEDS